MPRPKLAHPSYCLHRQSGRARVTIDGRQRLLPGKYDSPESRAAFDRLVGAWLANGRTLPAAAPAEPTGPTVAVVALAYWKFAQTFYVGADGKPTGEAVNVKYALRPLRRLYGATPAAEFGPRALKAMRAAMLLPQSDTDPKTGKTVTRPGWSRRYCNRQVDRIQRLFKWAAGEEMISAAVPAALNTVESIRSGREGARELPPVRPVAESHARAVFPYVAPQVRAMVELQLLAGMRPGEVVIMRGIDIDTGGKVWLYTPSKHKTSAHGHTRTIYFGPRGQAVLSPFLKSDTSAYLFSPRDAERARRDALHAARTTPLSCGNRPGSNRAPKTIRTVGARYTAMSYAQAVKRGCDRAYPAPAGLDGAELVAWRKQHRFHPHQLRHAAATNYRREADFESAKVLLGHRSDSMTTLYAERDATKAQEVALRIG